MPNLITPFKKIAQSGPCADGRRIEAQWLKDMAETYDPVLYEANLWPEHMRWGNNYGAVVALEVREEGGITSLYAQLAPNAFYVWDNQFDQKLHFSIEVQENFADSGKAYLVGLAITDSPASLGTDKMKFTRHSLTGGQVHVFSNVRAVSLCHDDDDDKAPGWFKKFWASLTPNLTLKEESMDPKQFETFCQRLDGMEAGMKDLKQSFTAGSGTTTSAETPSVADTAQASAFAADLGAALAPVLDSVQKLAAQVDGMSQRFEAAQTGTKFNASTGPADDAEALL